MKLTREQERAVLPMLRKAVNAQLRRWDAEHDIETFLDVHIDGVGQAIETLAVDGKVGVAELRWFLSDVKISK